MSVLFSLFYMRTYSNGSHPQLLYTHTTDRNLSRRVERRGSALQDYPKRISRPICTLCRFETFTEPSADRDSVSEHVPSGFCCLKVSKFDDEISDPYVYSGPDVMTKFYEHMYQEQEVICTRLKVQIDMSSLTDEEKSEYENAPVCPNCNGPFDQSSCKKVIHHCHTTGRFHGAVCAKCNLQLKYSKRKRPDNKNDEFFIPVIAHMNKKLSYRRGTARCVVLIEILPIATQQCRNYLYDKS